MNSSNVNKLTYKKTITMRKTLNIMMRLFALGFGDASIVTTAKEAKISKIESVDYKWGWHVLFTQYCAGVYDE
jgi:hypothetical protein